MTLLAGGPQSESVRGHQLRLTHVRASEAPITEFCAFGSIWYGAAERAWSTHRRDVQDDLQPQEYVCERTVVVAERRPFEAGALTRKARSCNADRVRFYGPGAADSRLSGRRWLVVEMALVAAGSTMLSYI